MDWECDWIDDDNDSFEDKVETIRNRRNTMIVKTTKIAKLISTDKMVSDNRYYVGAIGAITNNWGHADLDSAIEHAKDLCRGKDSVQIVVKIVAVVKPEEKPIVVEKLVD